MSTFDLVRGVGCVSLDVSTAKRISIYRHSRTTKVSRRGRPQSYLSILPFLCASLSAFRGSFFAPSPARSKTRCPFAFGANCLSRQFDSRPKDIARALSSFCVFARRFDHRKNRTSCTSNRRGQSPPANVDKWKIGEILLVVAQCLLAEDCQ